jgi:NAD(P) transhydrogenase
MNDPTYDFDLVSIGSGPAGQQAAIQAARLGRRAAVVERHRIVVGVCLETGTIPSKTFRQAVIEAVRPCGAELTGGFDAAEKLM